MYTVNKEYRTNLLQRRTVSQCMVQFVFLLGRQTIIRSTADKHFYTVDLYYELVY